MGLSSTQQFLVAATRSAAKSDYFRWRDVGVQLGYTAAESETAVKSLDERKLLILLSEGEARLLAAGRQLAVKLNARTARVK